LSTGSSSSGGLEIVAPSTSDVEFKYSWTIESFIKSVKSCKTEAGIDSRPFDINVNGVLTTWNLSVRFWVGETGERLANPFVLCLNLLSSKVDKPLDVNVKYKFGIYNRGSEEFEMGAIDRVGLRLEQTEKLQSIGYKNIAISEKHVNSAGDVSLVVRLTIIKENETNHSLSSDLKNLIDDEKSSDLILQSGSREFRVHSNILAARSPVFAALLKEKQLDEIIETNKENKGEEKEDGDEHKEEKEGEENKVKEEITKERKSISPRKISLGPHRLEIKDLPPDTLEVLLKYIYTDSSNNVDLFSQTLLAASDRYQLPGLKVHCEKHLGEIINPENVSDILLLSETHRCDTLKKTALAYCGENHSYIIKDSRWKVIEEEKPDLFEEAISAVAGGVCDSHTECLKKAGNRYECEKADKNQKSNKEPKIKQGGRKKSN
jgi:speckle-type POZ protein